MKKLKIPAILMLFTILIFILFVNSINSIPSTINVTNDLSKLNLEYNNIYKISYIDKEVSGNTNFKTVNASIKLFGVIPVKQVTINIEEEKKVMVGGDAIGVKLYTEGILVVGFSDIESKNGRRQSPAVVSGIQLGDMIVEIDDKQVKEIKDLTDIISKCNGKKIKMKIKRKDKYISLDIEPVLNKENQFKLGMWVRDSTSGIGTLTFIEPNLRKFAALGHPINDIDTGQIMEIRVGNIYKAKVIDIDKGVRGKPGELRGIFSEDDVLGEINKNNVCGIYGKINNTLNTKNTMLYPIASQDEVREGPAKIRVEIDEKVKEYDIIIERVTKQSSPSAKSMVIRITDKNLIEKTGGIVQGMSGSPIIQNGKLVGAVTHVFINRPDMGYAIYAEWMYNELKDNF